MTVGRIDGEWGNERFHEWIDRWMDGLEFLELFNTQSVSRSTASVSVIVIQVVV